MTPLSLELPAGRHTIEVHLEGHTPGAHELDVSPGGSHTLDLVLAALPEASGGTTAPPPSWGSSGGTPSRSKSAARRRRAFASSIQIGAGASIPVDMDTLTSAALVATGISLGANLGRVRLELAVDLGIVPHEAGVLLEAVAGPRLGIRLGALPLCLEIEALVGLYYLTVDTAGLVVPGGTHLGAALVVPTVAVAWEVLDWLEIVVRPARIEVIDLAGALPGGPSIRYGFNLALRFRYPSR